METNNGGSKKVTAKKSKGKNKVTAASNELNQLDRQIIRDEQKIQRELKDVQLLELKELEDCISALEELYAPPSREVIESARRLKDEFQKNIGSKNFYPDTKGINIIFQEALWGEQPPEPGKVIKQIIENVNTNAGDDYLTFRTTFITDENTFLKSREANHQSAKSAILDWEAAEELYTTAVTIATQSFKTQVIPLVNLEFNTVSIKKFNAELLDTISKSNKYYQNSEMLATSIQNYNTKMADALDNLNKSYGIFISKMIEVWTNSIKDEAALTFSNNKASGNFWSSINDKTDHSK